MFPRGDRAQRRNKNNEMKKMGEKYKKFVLVKY
jgi:hypothetical protein